jgi:hypothetical protein
MSVFEKSITYDHGDYKATLDGQLIGFFPNYHAAEMALDETAHDWLTHGYDRPASDLDEPAPDDAPGKDCDEHGPYDDEDCPKCEIVLARGRGAVIVDPADYTWLSQYNWCLHSKGYAVGYVDTQKVFMHRLILSPPAELQVDHINGNKLDNRRANLRITDSTGNNRNAGKRRTGTSQYKGVRWHQGINKWFAEIAVAKGNRKHLGCFSNELDAARAYDAAAREHHGEFARLNFPS